MEPETIDYTNLNKAIKLAEEIEKYSSKLRKVFFHLMKNGNKSKRLTH